MRFKKKRKIRTKPMKKLELPKPAAPKPIVQPSPQKAPRPTSPTLVRKPTSTILKIPIKPGFTPRPTPPPIKRENSVLSSVSTQSASGQSGVKRDRDGSVLGQSSSSKPMAPPQPKPSTQPKSSSFKPAQPKLSQSKPSLPKPLHHKPSSSSSSSSRPSSQPPRPLSQTPRPRPPTKIIKLKTGNKARKIEQIMNSEKKKLPGPKPLPSRAQPSPSPAPSSLNPSRAPFASGARPSPGPSAGPSASKNSSSSTNSSTGASKSVSTKFSTPIPGGSGAPALKKTNSLKLKFTKRVPEN